MLSKRVFRLLLTSFVVLPGSVVAQEYDVSRRTYSFFGDDLTVEVRAETSGALQLVRGGRGVLEVAGRGERSILGYAPPRRPGDALRLTALGGDFVEFVVVVPDGVRVQILTPEHGHVISADNQPVAVYRWDVEPEPVPEDVVAEPAGLMLTYVDETVPATVRIENLSAIRKLGVRLEGDEFGVAASEALALRRGDASQLDIRIDRAQPIDLLFILPLETRAFRLLVAGEEIYSVRNGRPVTRCSPVTLQTLAGGVRTADFTPLDGRLRCEG